MKKLTKLILSLALVLTVLASATNYQAADKAKLTFANGYDWTAQTNQVYVFASEDSSQSISALTGQDAATYAWFHTVILKDNGNGAYTVEKVGLGSETGAITEALGKGKVIIMAHDLVQDKDSYNWLKELKVGDKLSINASWSDIAAKFAEVVNYEISVAKATSTPSTTPDAGTTTTPDAGTSTPSTDVPSTGDATPVVAMASMLFVAVAFVALGLKKRNA